MSYVDRLAEEWRQNGGHINPEDPETRRPKTLRGFDFTSELLRLWHYTRDDRFLDALKALHEHEIVDGRWHFTNKPFGVIAELDQELIDWCDTMIKAGWSARRTYAEVAAAAAVHANSFPAAMKKLETMHKRVRENAQRETSNDSTP